MRNIRNVLSVVCGYVAAVIGAETELIEKCLAPIEDVSIANYNCPGQIVISGKKAAVKRPVKSLRLPVQSGPVAERKRSLPFRHAYGCR